MAAREAAVFVRRRRRVHARCDRTCDAVLKGKRSAGPVFEQLLAFFRNVAYFRRRQRGLFGARWGKIRARASRVAVGAGGSGLAALAGVRRGQPSASPKPPAPTAKEKGPGERCGGRTARQTLGALSGALEVRSEKYEVRSTESPSSHRSGNP